MINRFFNTKKIRILAKIRRVFTSKHRNQSFMSEDFVDSFYQEAKSSFTRFTFFKLITEVFDLFRSSRNTKSRSSTRRIVKNLESHHWMSENFKKKQKTKMNLLKEVVESNNRSENRATYNKTSYNRDVVAILLIVSKKKYNLSIFQQEFTSKVVAIVRSLYNLMSNSKKTQYLAQAQKFLNSRTFDYINQSLSYFYVWIIRFFVESSLNNKNLELSIKWFSRKSILTKKHSNRTEILEKIFEESKNDKFSRSSLIFRQSSRRSTSKYHERSKNSYLNHESFRHSKQKRRIRFEENLNVKSDKYRKKFCHHQSKYQNSFKMIKYSFESFTKYFSESIQQRQNFRHKQIVNFDHYDDFQRNFRQRFCDANSMFVFRENRKLQFVSLTHDYDYESRFFQKNFRKFEFIKSVRLRSSDVMIFNSKKHFAVFFIRRFQHIAKFERQRSILRVLLMCFVEIALEWHNSLSSTIRQKMNSNLRTWENELFKEFRSNKFVSLLKRRKSWFFVFKNLWS
jgi:hypothetical protein